MSSVAQDNSMPKPNRASRRSTSTVASVQNTPKDNHRSSVQDSASPNKQSEIEQEKETPEKRPSKRRKVNHACVYCRRSHMTCDQGRPCSRCIKRNIPHLCHDEPREAKKSRDETDKGHGEDSYSPNDQSEDHVVTNSNINLVQPRQHSQDLSQESLLPPVTTVASDMNQPRIERGPLAENFTANQLLFNELNIIPQDQLQGIHSQAFASMFNNQELNHEYNLLNNFLASSLLDDGAFYQGDNPQHQFSDPSFSSIMGPLSTFTNSVFPSNNLYNQIGLTPTNTNGSDSNKKSSNKRASNVDKAQEKYYLTAADPGGVEDSESRINKLLKAKYEAGLLKPFNYVKGYAKLNTYMEKNMQVRSRQKIFRQLETYRPKFRERMQSLTDVELVLVEIWFERKLMEYDRVFASMAIPACCWRRTGEIFRGNRAMAELIGVSLEQLRDGTIALHEIVVEDSLVAYWEKFGSIAFDNNQKGILTQCVLKNPAEASTKETEIKCCFSFMIQRDTHSIPSLIIGNFLPLNPTKT